MKPVHDKVAKEAFVVGNTYNVSLRGKPLYAAEVVKFHGGCWATVRVTKPLSDETAQMYSPGAEFDIKVAEYDLLIT
ncbi:MAG: hypothetical protein IPH85_06665 [Ignavibacteria bacterium]|mgnify:CR=1 FL=1|nr:hypothetical protein [Ignavibacteria bacterium]MBK6417764.1 hypothetical protein [Ignavibacteria bacterium]MBK6760795.1 hypothetical protein [Ignavibacteria bacterium]MBK7031796.1 hypothetical protein [Ignavibacteria bacterium]MBK7185600.1 hypothetical protein [Ignavibacteria bacterium]